MIYRSVALASAFLAAVQAQQVGTSQAEVHPPITTKKCTTGGGCVTQQQSVVLDSNWRWLHNTGGFTNCYSGSTWNTQLCPDGVTCAAQCAIEGANYSGTYGITTSGDSLTLRFVTGANVGSRVYLLASDSKYQMFKLKNQEFTFDVDMSNLPCGLNGALYMIEMDEDGGMAKNPGNKAGAKYGTGYCDAQCPHDIKFISGEANVIGWNPSATDPNAGNGKYGSCCPEMDIWEANSRATAYTPHPCVTRGPYRCSSPEECGDGQFRYDSHCDKDGCDFNSWRMGDRTFLGRGFSGVDTTKKITVVTQFITDNGTASGNLSEIKRFYVQDGRVIANSNSNLPNFPVVNSLTDSICIAKKNLFNDYNAFNELGGMSEMGRSYDTGMVLSMSIWGDHAANMLWLDSEFPLDKDPALPGISRGPCPRDSGVPADLVRDVPNSSVTFSNIRWGDIGSTFSGTTPSSSTRSSSTSSSTIRSSTSSTSTRPSSSSTSSSTSRSSSSSSSSRSSSSTAVPGTVPRWGQCGGQSYSGPTTCEAPWTCVFSNPWYSQCL